MTITNLFSHITSLCKSADNTYVGWECEKYALLIEIIILPLFFLTIVIPT